MERWKFEKGLVEVGQGAYAYLQPDGSWDWSNAGLITDQATVTLLIGAASPETSSITAAPTLIVADGEATSTIRVQLKELAFVLSRRCPHQVQKQQRN